MAFPFRLFKFLFFVDSRTVKVSLVHNFLTLSLLSVFFSFCVFVVSVFDRLPEIRVEYHRKSSMQRFINFQMLYWNWIWSDGNLSESNHCPFANHWKMPFINPPNWYSFCIFVIYYAKNCYQKSQCTIVNQRLLSHNICTKYLTITMIFNAVLFTEKSALFDFVFSPYSKNKKKLSWTLPKWQQKIK